MSRLKSAATKNIDIDIADILGQKYRYRIDIGKGDIDPPQIDIITISLVNGSMHATAGSGRLMSRT